MSLLKKNEIPKEIISKPEDIVFDLENLDDYMGETLFGLIYDKKASTIFIAGPSIKDLPFWASYYDYPAIPADVKKDELLVISLTVQDPKNLPYELEQWQDIAVLCDDWEFARFDSMDSAVEEIEFLINNMKNVEIDDFIIFTYTELIDTVKTQIVERIKYYWKIRGKKCQTV